MSYLIQFNEISSYCIYFASIFFAVFFAFLSDRHLYLDLYTRKICWMLSFLCLFLPVAFRGYGVDHQAYINWYNSIKSFGVSYFNHYNFMPEPLYALLNFIVANTVDDVQYVFIISAFIPLVFIYSAFSKYKGRVDLALCIWTFCFTYYLFMFGLVRISIALGIITYAYSFLEDKKIKKYSFFCFLAFLFHYSAIIMLPVYFLVNFKPSIISRNNFSIFKYSIIYIFSTIFLFYLAYKFFPFLFGDFSWFGRYNHYLQADPNWKIIKSQAFVIPIVGMLIIWKLYFINEIYKIDLYIKLIIIMFTFAFGSIFFPIQRVCFYFIPACCFLYASVPKLKFSLYKREQSIIISLYYMLMFLIGISWVYLIVFRLKTWGPFLIPYYINFPS